ncbi:MAG: Xaa-Pro peptidase family protein [Candidatus Aenigmatarchaeota archaeon]
MNEWKLLEESGVSAALLFSSDDVRDVNFDYFSGFKKPTYSFYLISKKNLLITSSIDYERALKETEKDVIKLKDYGYSLKKVLKKFYRGKVLGVIASKFPLSLAKSLRGYKLVDIGNKAKNIRAIKNKHELKLIKKSCHVANKGIDFIRKKLSQEKTEAEFARELQEYLKRFDIEGFSFNTIVSSGKRSAFIHPYPTASNKKISNGLGLIDFGVVYKGYCSDVTIPFSFGKLSQAQQKIIESVLECYDVCKDAAKEGVIADQLFKIAESFLSQKGFELKHGIGHGIGLEVHDPPSLSFKSDDVLQKNMVITLEPGIYEINQGGFRIENDFVVGKKLKPLTKSKYLEF